jgi:hypothetical protein
MTFTKNRLHRNITFERAQFEVAEEPVSPRPHPDGQEKHKGSPGLSGIS